MIIKEFPYILYRFDKAKSDTFFDINSSGKKIISNIEYLSTSKGVQGHIVGFLKYDPSMENDNALQYTTIKGALTAFHNKIHHPDLIILDPWDLFGLVWDGKIVDATNYGETETIPITPDKLKFAQLGEQMAYPNTNSAEIDFVGDIRIKAKVFRNIDKSETIKQILDREYLAFHKELPTMPKTGLLATIPLDSKPFWGGRRRIR